MVINRRHQDLMLTRIGSLNNFYSSNKIYENKGFKINKLINC